MRTIRVGLIGLGTVGTGVVEILRKHREHFQTRAGVDIELVRFADRNESRFTDLGLPPEACTNDALALIDDPELDIVIELIGGTGVAREVVLKALGSGKNVVTANKALLANHGEEVLQAAEKNGVDLYFEASVGAGIPIIGPLKHSLTSNEIDAVMGIVNGTTNYMLTRMAEDGLDYGTALSEAQVKGFAEADPTADVEGHDAAAKIAILSSIAFNSRVAMSQVPTEGITSIAPADIAYAERMDSQIKLLAIGRRVDDEIDVRVHPTMIPNSHPLASVNGVYNAIYVIGDAVGKTMFFGEGAGSLSAASAIVGDVIEVARRIDAGCAPVVGCTCTEELSVRDITDLETRYYVRLVVADRPGVLAATAKVFGDNGVSLASVIQQGAGEDTAELVYVTHTARESDVRRALEDIRAHEAVARVESVIRVEDL